MFDVATIHSASADLLANVSRSADGDGIGVEPVLARLGRNMVRWLGNQTTIRASEGVLTTAEDLLLALRDIHPEGFPETYREEAERMVTVLEEAVKWGMEFDVDPLRRSRRGVGMP